MASPTAAAVPVLVYHRIAHNRRMTVLLLAIATVFMVPFITTVSLGVSVTWWALTRCSALTEWSLATAAALAMVGVLGILLSSMASEPTSKVLQLIGARPPAGEEIEAKRLLENLSIGAGLPVPRFYVIDTLAPNACAAGMDPSHSAVAVTVGILKLLEKRELEAVLAHELSHIANRDTRLNTLVAAIALFLRIPYLLYRDHADDGSEARISWPHLPLGEILLLPVRAYLFFTMPLAAVMIRAAVSRNREFLADADAALLTRCPEGLIRALAKIGGAGSAIEAMNPSVAHLYFANPSGLDGDAGPLADRLFDTHPPISERINLLSKFEGGLPQSEIEAAVHAGEAFAQQHLARLEARSFGPAPDELSVFTAGNPAGRVFRLAGVSAPLPVYDQPLAGSRVVAHVMSGDLLVVFDDPGPMREVLTSSATFGYLSNRAKLERVDMLPAEVFDSDSRTSRAR